MAEHYGYAHCPNCHCITGVSRWNELTKIFFHNAMDMVEVFRSRELFPNTYPYESFVCPVCSTILNVEDIFIDKIRMDTNEDAIHLLRQERRQE